ncbi:putative oxidoreductase, Zn-dependent and NAD(P)-binding [Mesorhizobium plurifarium]|uniref:Putative oxidoreductase, Zn-dependent and NAD(P)-binding n=1 Tax=Mesorhizobium plurifarium TaxID=69974 RepID=A0A090EUI2_MESPL|nr:putative oxidoreductase, Zn-dependent and NAD(P)-binding [Mesorhizobium sp. SOD10]CDX35280.1 putative oxidoreductase, Zn-dependent and NAD(P)-binding [Mesorhizobium plurifarium]
MFKALLIERDDNGQRVGLSELREEQLPEGDVTVRVASSTLNYKDALAITGKAPVVRRFPMVPGIDFAGVVEHSDNPSFRSGDKVVLNGWGVGEVHWGGLSEVVRVKGEWLIRLEPSFSFSQAMSIGTAGYTAMLCVMALERHGLTPASGQVLVTGASGGVGSVAIAVLAKLGYEVAAVTGRTEEAQYLTKLGAKRILPRSDFSEPAKPLAREQWAGAVDVVGGYVLANVCASLKYRGVVTACGLAGDMTFPATVAPFILRGVTLAGIDSVMCPTDERREAWRRLGEDLDPTLLDSMVKRIAIEDAVKVSEQLIAGAVRGRVVVPVNDL